MRKNQRKFRLVDVPEAVEGANPKRLIQAYWHLGGSWSLRFRRELDPGDGAVAVHQSLTVKGRGVGNETDEFTLWLESLPAGELDGLVRAAGDNVVEKMRYQFDVGSGERWCVDVFSGANAGLIIAEADEFDGLGPPWEPWSEVTGDARYANEHLAANPFEEWNVR